jgi:hypothetical protein
MRAFPFRVPAHMRTPPGLYPVVDRSDVVLLDAPMSSAPGP